MKTKTYWTLAERGDDGKWGPQFGDYDREVVMDELDEYVRSGQLRKNLIVVKSGDKQLEIELRITELNEKYAAE